MEPDELKQWRHTRGWSLSKAASELGVARNSYRRWEKGDRKISETVIKLILLLDNKSVQS